MRIILASIIICYSILASAQQTPEFGSITPEDFSVTRLDSVSSSVIIFNKGTYVAGDQPTIERHVRVKINDKEAIDKWGDFKLGSYFETTTKVRAATYYLEEGKVVSDVVEKDAIFKDIKSNREKIVSLTNLREGCIIELKYKSRVNYPGIPTWFIQDEVPVLWSEFLLMAHQKLTYVTYGDYPPSIFDPKYKRLYYRWVFENIPAFETEPLMPPLVNYFARIEFWSRQEAWADINRAYLAWYTEWQNEFEHIYTKRKIKTALDSLKDPLEQARLISSYVKANYTWTGYDAFLASKYSSMFEEKKGNSAELNMLLYGMLEWAGLNPEFVLLSTKENGLTRKDIPSASQFNYMLCRILVAREQYLLDATDPKLPFNIVPQRCFNSDGLIISETGPHWVPLEPDIKERIKANAWFSITPELALKGRCTILNQGYRAIEQNKKFETLGLESYRKETKFNDGWIGDSIRIAGNIGDDLNFSVTHYGVATGNINAVGTRIFIDPYILLKVAANPFLEETREFPIQMDQQSEQTLMLNLAIPAGYQVETVPASQAISFPDKTITASFKTLDDGKNVVVVFAFNIQRTWFGREEYGNLRAFFDRLIAKHNEMIVLVKT